MEVIKLHSFLKGKAALRSSKEGSAAKTASDTCKNATFQVSCETLNIHKMINRKYFVIIPFCPRCRLLGKHTTSVLVSNFDSHICHCTQVFAKASLSWLISCCFTQEGKVIQYMKCKLNQPSRGTWCCSRSYSVEGL